MHVFELAQGTQTTFSIYCCAIYLVEVADQGLQAPMLECMSLSWPRALRLLSQYIAVQYIWLRLQSRASRPSGLSCCAPCLTSVSLEFSLVIGVLSSGWDPCLVIGVLSCHWVLLFFVFPFLFLSFSIIVIILRPGPL